MYVDRLGAGGDAGPGGGGHQRGQHAEQNTCPTQVLTISSHYRLSTNSLQRELTCSACQIDEITPGRSGIRSTLVVLQIAEAAL